MGTWAEGNFANDGALDFVGGVMDGLVARINQCFADEYAAALDEDGEAVIVPGVHLLFVISDTSGAAPPEAALVTQWKEKYLALFDEQIDGLEPAGDYAEKRRAIIEDTFTRLEDRSREFWRRG